MNPKIGLGGSCHWCTEGIFCSVKGVENVCQGWISATPPQDTFSEAILFEYDPGVISLVDLLAIHLYSHSCTKRHSMRNKYRSAIYVFDASQELECRKAIQLLQMDFEEKILTEVLYFNYFKLNSEEYLDYYFRNPDKPFCKTYIEPKLRSLMERYSDVFNAECISHFLKHNGILE
ncbi:MAG: peptide-methionine (S)-S-oxide reductase [Cryomorphaceae bacterium]